MTDTKITVIDVGVSSFGYVYVDCCMPHYSQVK